MTPPTWTKASLKLYHADCMDVMRQFPNGHFDLAVVDPPYGIGAAMNGNNGGQTASKKWKAPVEKFYQKKEWDSKPPPKKYFTELRRVSKNQIIWGGNYFRLHPSPCWIVWDKLTNGSLADCELAWTSFDTAVRKVELLWNGFARCEVVDRIHPTQKPVALYRWLLAKYAKPGQRILDTHLGGGSHAIAAHYAGMDFTGIELDADYFAAACERIDRETAQGDMFTPPASLPALSQPSLAL